MLSSLGGISTLVFAPRRASNWVRMVGLVYLLLVFQASQVQARMLPLELQTAPAGDGLFQEHVDGKIRNAQEWNQLIPQGFRDAVLQQPQHQPGSAQSPSLEQLKANLSALEFETLSSHMTAMETSAGIVERREKIAKRLLARMSKNSDPSSNLPSQQTGVYGSTSVGMNNAQILLASESHLTVQQSLRAKLEEFYQSKSVSVNSGAIMNALTENTVQSLNQQVEAGKSAEQGTGQGEVVQAHIGYVEAFDLTVPVENASSEMLSMEPAQGESLKRGWRYSSAEGHLPTLNWSDPVELAPVEWVPLMSYNTVKSLKAMVEQTKKEEIQLDTTAGIIFGKVAAGWEVHYSDRSEAPIFLDMNLQPLGDGDFSNDRYFVFLNAQAGTGMMFLSQSSGESGAVAAPVLGGVSTYLDLTRIFHTTVDGQVFSATGTAGESPEPLGETTVRVIGQEGSASVSDGDGFFQFTDILGVGSYPLFIETDRARGFTHRYKISTDKLHDINLFRIPVRIVNTWLEKVPGGVLDGSALVVGAVPGMVNENPDFQLIPSVRPLLSPVGMSPETGTIAPWDEFRMGYPLAWEETRFLSANVPEGPIVTQVTDIQTKKVIWSELDMASPGVINLIGPF